MPKPLPPVRRAVPMEESMLLSMAQSPQFVVEFPFLSRLAGYAVSTGPGCSTCGGNAKSVQKQAAIDAVKLTIFEMPDEKKKTLKRLLNADRVSVILRIGQNVVERSF